TGYILLRKWPVDGCTGGLSGQCGRTPRRRQWAWQGKARSAGRACSAGGRGGGVAATVRGAGRRPDRRRAGAPVRPRRGENWLRVLRPAGVRLAGLAGADGAKPGGGGAAATEHDTTRPVWPAKQGWSAMNQQFATHDAQLRARAERVIPGGLWGHQ